MLILVGLTWYYARKTAQISAATDKQAEASRQMAAEMERQRKTAVRPIIAIEPALLASTGNPPRWDLKATLRNVGMGPAIDVIFTCEQGDGPGSEEGYARHRLAALGVGSMEEVRFSVRKERLDGLFANSLKNSFLPHLVCDYEDIFGSPFSSWREIGALGGVGLISGRLFLEKRKIGVDSRHHADMGL